MPRRLLRHQASARTVIPFPQKGDENDAAAMAGRSSKEKLGLLRRWSLAGGLSGDIAIPQELSEVQERQNSATATNSEAPHSGLPLIDMKKRENIQDGNTGRLCEVLCPLTDAGASSLRQKTCPRRALLQ